MSGMTWGVDSSFPEIYEEVHVPAFFHAFTEALLDLAAPVAGDRMLDVATGTGVVVRGVLRQGPDLERLTALDFTPAMLAIAREAVPHVEWVHGDATQLPFADDDFDLVTCQQGLQFFPDRAAAVSEMRRVLAPGGRAVVACWREIETSPCVNTVTDVLAMHAPEIVPACRNPFVLHNADEFGGLFDAAGFSDVSVEEITLDAVYASADEFTRAWLHGTPVAIPFAGVSPEVRQKVIEEAIERLTPLEDESGLRFPMSTHAVVARVL